MGRVCLSLLHHPQTIFYYALKNTVSEKPGFRQVSWFKIFWKKQKTVCQITAIITPISLSSWLHHKPCSFSFYIFSFFDPHFLVICTLFFLPSILTRYIILFFLFLCIYQQFFSFFISTLKVLFLMCVNVFYFSIFFFILKLFTLWFSLFYFFLCQLCSLLFSSIYLFFFLSSISTDFLLTYLQPVVRPWFYRLRRVSSV